MAGGTPGELGRCFRTLRRSQREEGLSLPHVRVSYRPFPGTARISAPLLAGSVHLPQEAVGREAGPTRRTLQGLPPPAPIAPRAPGPAGARVGGHRGKATGRSATPTPDRQPACLLPARGSEDVPAGFSKRHCFHGPFASALKKGHQNHWAQAGCHFVASPGRAPHGAHLQHRTQPSLRGVRCCGHNRSKAPG